MANEMLLTWVKVIIPAGVVFFAWSYRQFRKSGDILPLFLAELGGFIALYPIFILAELQGWLSARTVEPASLVFIMAYLTAGFVVLAKAFPRQQKKVIKRKIKHKQTVSPGTTKVEKKEARKKAHQQAVQKKQLQRQAQKNARRNVDKLLKRRKRK